MLTHIQIKNFTIIDELSLDLHTGLTVLTGETGAGKSIVIDALALALGERAESACIRPGQARCEITAIFDIRQIPAANEWLAAQEFEADPQCIFYRILSEDGRSRSSINGRNVPLQTIRELAALLVNICSQNQHQALLKREQPLLLVDAFAGSTQLREDLRKIYANWQQAKNQLDDFTRINEGRSARRELLDFYIKELSDFGVADIDFSTLNQAHQQLHHAENRLSCYQQALALLADDEDTAATHNMYHVIKQLNAMAHQDSHSTKIIELLNNALIYIEESVDGLRTACESVEINPAQLAELEEKINKMHQLARKHQVNTEDLPTLYHSLCAELTTLTQGKQSLDDLKAEIEKLSLEYEVAAKKLTAEREQAAQKLQPLITAQIKTLGMPQAEFVIQLLAHASPTAQGREQIEFLVSVNPGQPLRALSVVASGGELSRIALAIQVMTRGEQMIPTMVFDEVDVGIGGGTAEIVGKLLRQLAKKSQVLCITHLPQVAAQGHQHLQVKKIMQDTSTTTTICSLDEKEKVQEVARMLGGIKITEQTLAHAENMLSLVE